jgi:hypothetical protein
MWETYLLSVEVGEEELLYQMIRNQGGELGWLHYSFTGEEQLAVRKEVRRRVGLEGVGLLDLAASAWDMHLGLADFHVRKLGGGLFQDRVVGLAGFTGRKAVGDDRRGCVGELLVIFVSDVLD